MKMSERISAAANQPTPEQIRAAHRAIAEIAAMSVWGGFPNGLPMEAVRKLLALVDSIRPALPPLPEPERPRITPAGELVTRTLIETNWVRPPEMPGGDIEYGVRLSRAEIIAWLEHKLRTMGHDGWRPDDCERCALDELLAALRKDDTP